MGNRRLSLSNYRRALQIDELIAAEKYPNVAFLMQKFECSEATVLRAIETLRNDSVRKYHTTATEKAITTLNRISA